MTNTNDTKKSNSIGTKSVKKSIMAFLTYYRIICSLKGHKWENKMGDNGEPYAICTVCPCWKADCKIYTIQTDLEDIIYFLITMVIGGCIGVVILFLLNIFNIV